MGLYPTNKHPEGPNVIIQFSKSINYYYDCYDSAAQREYLRILNKQNYTETLQFVNDDLKLIAYAACQPVIASWRCHLQHEITVRRLHATRRLSLPAARPFIWICVFCIQLCYSIQLNICLVAQPDAAAVLLLYGGRLHQRRVWNIRVKHLQYGSSGSTCRDREPQSPYP